MHYFLKLPSYKICLPLLDTAGLESLLGNLETSLCSLAVLNTKIVLLDAHQVHI